MITDDSLALGLAVESQQGGGSSSGSENRLLQETADLILTETGMIILA